MPIANVRRTRCSFGQSKVYLSVPGNLNTYRWLPGERGGWGIKYSYMHGSMNGHPHTAHTLYLITRTYSVVVLFLSQQ